MLDFALTLLMGAEATPPSLALYYRQDAYEIQRNLDQPERVFLDGYVISLTNDCIEQSLNENRTRPVPHAYMFDYEIEDVSIIINAISRPWYSEGVQTQSGGELIFTCTYLRSDDRHSFDLDQIIFYE